VAWRMRRFCVVFAKKDGFGPAGNRVCVVSPLMDKVKYRPGPEPPQAASVNRHEDASVNGLDTEIPSSLFHEEFNFS
jgi:hypothetical protein